MDKSNKNEFILFIKKFPGVLFTLIFFFGTMLIAFGAEFLVSDTAVFFGLIGISIGYLIFCILLFKKRRLDCLKFCGESIVTVIILAVLILPTGFLEKFIEFRNQFDYYWEGSWFKGLQWIFYPFVPAIFLLLLTLIACGMSLYRYIRGH